MDKYETVGDVPKGSTSTGNYNLGKAVEDHAPSERGYEINTPYDPGDRTGENLGRDYKKIEKLKHTLLGELDKSGKFEKILDVGNKMVFGYKNTKVGLVLRKRKKGFDAFVPTSHFDEIKAHLK